MEKTILITLLILGLIWYIASLLMIVFPQPGEKRGYIPDRIIVALQILASSALLIWAAYSLAEACR